MDPRASGGVYITSDLLGMPARVRCGGGNVCLAEHPTPKLVTGNLDNFSNRGGSRRLSTPSTPQYEATLSLAQALRGVCHVDRVSVRSVVIGCNDLPIGVASDQAEALPECYQAVQDLGGHRTSDNVPAVITLSARHRACDKQGFRPSRWRHGGTTPRS